MSTLEITAAALASLVTGWAVFLGLAKTYRKIRAASNKKTAARLKKKIEKLKEKKRNINK